MSFTALRKRRQLQQRVRALAPRVLAPGRAAGPGAKGFYLVHYNAPDFLELALDAIGVHHPESAVTVLDNGSRPEAIDAVKRAVRRRPHVRVLLAHGDKPRHTVGLQALFALAVEDGVSTAVFLDQDALLLCPVDDLAARLGANTRLVGAADAVFIPRTDGPLKSGWMRSAPSRIHPSLLLLDPSRVRRTLGPWPFAYDRRAERSARRGGWEYEPYHALSVRAEERIVFLDTRMCEALPPLTFYELGGHAYACHAWYSSRTEGRSDTDQVDTLPVAWIKARRAAILERMRELASGRYPSSAR